MMFRPVLASSLLLLVLHGSACSRGERDEQPSAAEPATAAAQPTDALAAVGDVVAVWLQDRGDGRDTLARGRHLVPVAWDSVGRAERDLAAAPGSYAKPLVVPGGSRRFLFSDRHARTIWQSNGPGSPPTRVGDGVALAIWRAPDGALWVYAGREPTVEDPGEYRRLERFRLDAPDTREALPLKGILNEDNFQLTPDGRLGGGVFPWPKVGWFDMATGASAQVAEGCWAGVAPMASPLLCFLDGAHRRMTIVSRAEPQRRWSFTFDSIPPLRGHEIYHPRWTSHPRVFVLTGPYVATTAGQNAVRSGGVGVDVYLVLLNASLTTVERWSRLSTNQRADFYPDAWVAPDAHVSVDASPGPAVTAVAPSPAHRVVVDATLMTIADPPAVPDIAPYTQALVAGRYVVTRVVEGRLAEPVIAVAHWVIKDRRPLAEARRRQGTSYRLVLEPYARRVELDGERLVMTPDAAALPLYYDLSSR